MSNDIKIDEINEIFKSLEKYDATVESIIKKYDKSKNGELEVDEKDDMSDNVYQELNIIEGKIKKLEHRLKQLDVVCNPNVDLSDDSPDFYKDTELFDFVFGDSMNKKLDEMYGEVKISLDRYMGIEQFVGTEQGADINIDDTVRDYESVEKQFDDRLININEQIRNRYRDLWKTCGSDSVEKLRDVKAGKDLTKAIEIFKQYAQLLLLKVKVIEVRTGVKPSKIGQAIGYLNKLKLEESIKYFEDYLKRLERLKENLP